MVKTQPMNFQAGITFCRLPFRQFFALLNLPLLVVGCLLVLLGRGVLVSGHLNWQWQLHMDLLYQSENSTSNWLEVLQTPLYVPRTFLTVVGSIFIALASLACICPVLYKGHSRMNSCFYIWYSIILGISLFFNIAFIFCVGAFLSRAVRSMRESVHIEYIKDDHSNYVNVLWDSAQLFLQCCGYSDGSDYSYNDSFYPISSESNSTTTTTEIGKTFQRMLVPPSCCKPSALDAFSVGDESLLNKCTTNRLSELSNFHLGCADKILPYAWAILWSVVVVCLYLIPLVVGASVIATNRRKYIPVESTTASDSTGEELLTACNGAA